jgi:hypothetical protein
MDAMDLPVFFEPLEPRLLLDGALPTFTDAGAVPNVQVEEWSVPHVVDWNEDGRPDLLVGEQISEYCGPCGGDRSYGKVRLYLNFGPPGNPGFGPWSYVQAGGTDLTVSAAGCLGCFPHAADWNGDGKKDLLLGQADGRIQVFLNSGTDAAPAFTTGDYVQAGDPGSKAPIDVGDRATLDVVDWNNDGRLDLVTGDLTGRVSLFLNLGTPTAPDLQAPALVQDGGSDLGVPTARSSPVVTDLDADGRKDLLAGNTDGQLVFYRNTGTDAAPTFDGGDLLDVDGLPLDLFGAPRSRPDVADLNADGLPDLLVGARDGLVRRYEAVAPDSVDLTATLDLDKCPTWVLPGDRKLGRIKRIGVEIANGGTAVAEGNAVVDLYASLNDTLDKAGDVLLATTVESLGLKPGKTASARFSKLVVPDVPPGDYFLIADVDAGDAVAETDEDNNVAVSGRTVAWQAAERDLTGTLDTRKCPARVIPGHRKLGEIKKVSVDITNQGNVPAAGPVVVDLYASLNDTLDKAGDVRLGREQMRKKSLQPGKTKSCRFSKIAVPDLPPGDYFLIADIDVPDAVDETDETNNAPAGARTVAWQAAERDLAGRMDLSKAPAVVVPGDRKAGQIKKVTVELTNQGNIEAAGLVTLDLYASTDKTRDKGADTRLGRTTKKVKLRPGKTKKLRFAKIDVPALPDGDYHLLADLDAENVIPESDETNNLLVGSRTIAWQT